jgi:hypothetical protein
MVCTRTTLPLLHLYSRANYRTWIRSPRIRSFPL